MQTNRPPIIEANNLHKFYGTFPAVDGISFRVEPGECFGLLGPNGAGKTTTISMLYGMTPKSAGELRVFGEDVSTQPVAIKKRLGVCQQEDNLDPDLSIEENLLVFARYFAIPSETARSRTEELLLFMSLDTRRHEKVQNLSGGLKRRLVLARALINEPELLILDEPTTGLDPQSRQLLWQRIRELKRKGITILLTTHYMDEAQQLCDRLIIVDGGKILVEGRPRELILEHVGHEVIEVDDPPATLAEFLRSEGIAYEDLGYRLVIYSSGGSSLYQQICSRFSGGVSSLRQGTLEDLFLRLTGRNLRD